MSTSSPTQSSEGFANVAVVRLEEQQTKNNSLLRTALRRLRRDYLTIGALAVLLTLTVLSFAAPFITESLGVSPTRTQPLLKHLPLGGNESVQDGDTVEIIPHSEHVLGTDSLGRDHLARLLYGGQISLTIAFSAAIFASTIGVALGLLSGYYQGTRFGFIDDIIMWLITTLASIPLLMLLILIASVLSPNIPTLILVLVLVFWPGTMRLIRGETLAYREREFVLAAKAVGASPVRIMFTHIFPNTLSILITSLAIEIGTLILVESALSFLGLGVRPPDPSWGNMLTSAQSSFRQAAHLSIFPGLLIVVTVLSLYLVGDGLRDAFDPRSTK